MPISTPRWLALASMLALASAPSFGCAAESGTATSDGAGASTDPITSVDHSDVKRQSIGNCWIYATSSWLEALDSAATGEAKNTSESWLTYWHWFEQIASGQVEQEVTTAGGFEVAVSLISRYGVMMEKDFIPSEAEAEMSLRQSSAFDAINASLKDGALKDARLRRDRALVRRELDKAWGLAPEVVSRIDGVFGAGVSRTLEFMYRSPGGGVLHARDVKARLKDPYTGRFVVGTLADAIGMREGPGWWYPRSGSFAWQEVTYPREPAARRALWRRVQRALHDRQPVVMTWTVDFNALTSSARFSLDQLQQRGPGSQGVHLTVAHDYQADVPFVGLLEAGRPATPEQMQAALADDTKIEFVRVKNSWGGIRPDRWSEAAIPGYHDLEMDYLNGPIQKCGQKPDGTTDRERCASEVTPLSQVVLPAGY